MAEPTLERFRRVIATAHAHLEARRDEINDLNVFPVADGDTGDNMALTMRAALDALERLDDDAADQEVGRHEIVDTIARAALMGARGNSGVILSQIVRGAAEELARRQGELIDPVVVVAALGKAAEVARQSVRDPVDGTILTVVQEMANAVSQHINQMESPRLGHDVSDEEQDALLAEILEAAVEAGERAVQRTPEQLEVLRSSGVVDAGGHGLVLMFAGVVAGLRGDAMRAPEIARQAPAAVHAPHHEDSRFRYCVNFIVTGSSLNGDSFTPALEEVGDSVLVVGDERTLRVHVHADDPEAAFALFDGAGEVSRPEVADMHLQMIERASRLAEGATGLVAVVAGSGIERIFRDEAGASVVSGGSTLNPSTEEILAAIEAVAADGVLVLPNSSNVVMAAERAVALADKPARVLATTSQQAGIAVLPEFNPADTLDQNEERLTGALRAVRVGSVAPAARDDAQGRFMVGDAVGFVEDDIVAWGRPGPTLQTVAEKLAEGAEFISVVGGATAPIRLDDVEALLPEGPETELQEGGQPHHWWLLAAQ